MNRLPPDEIPPGTPLETRLREHFDEQFVVEYGEPLLAATVLERIQPRLHSLATRAQAMSEGAMEALRGRAHSVLGRTAAQVNDNVEVTPGRSSAPATTTRSQRLLAMLAPVAAVLVVVALAAMLFLPRLMQPAFPVPSGWHDVTPPTPEAITSYAASPDVPGLILACIGGRGGSLSASPMGPAYIWRTRDGGQTWAQLTQPVFTAGCQIAAIRGAAGTFVIEDIFATRQALWVTHDAGSTWAQIPVTDQSFSVQTEFELLAQGVYRNGALYVPGVYADTANGATSNQIFSETHDDGRTWTSQEPALDANIAQGYRVFGIAPDESASGNWYRLLASATIPQSSDAPPTPDALIEHSVDNGKTWTVVGRIKVAGPAAGAMPLSAMTSGADGRLCVVLDVYLPSEQSASSQSSLATSAGEHLAQMSEARDALAFQGPPYLPPTEVSLYGSDDRGVTWRGGTIVRYSGINGRPVLPGVQIDAAGNCLLATTHIQFTPGDTTTIWKLAPGNSTAQPALQLPGIILGYFAIAHTADGSRERLVGLATKAGPMVEVTCQDPAPCVAPPPVTPHLIWTDAP